MKRQTHHIQTVGGNLKRMIKPSKPNRFIVNMQEFNSYFVTRKKVKAITNTDRLLNLISLYFETLLRYRKINIGNNQVMINGRIFLAEINGVNKKGEEVKIGFDQIGENLITNILQDLKITLNTTSFLKYINICNEIIETKNIDISSKIDLLNAEGKSFGKQWQYLLFEIGEELALKSIELRKELVFTILKQKPNLLQNENESEDYLKSVYDSYDFLVKSAIRVFIFNNHFDSIFKFIYQEFEYFLQIPDEIELDDNRISFFLLRLLILNNNIFQLERQELIEEYFIDKEEFLTEENRNLIESDIKFSLKDLELQNASIELAEPSFEGLDQNQITTFITFTIPGYRIENDLQIKLDKNVILEVNNINTLYDDPIFKFLDDSELTINSFPLSVFSDSIGNTNNSINLSFIIQDFYHPDFNITNNGSIEHIDFTEQDAKIGRKYYPHKEYIIELLRRLKKERESEFPFEIELEKITIDLISNYYVSYHDLNKNLIYHKVHTITNLNSYLKVKQRFLTKLSELNLSEDSDDIRNLIFDIEITNTRILNKFIHKLIQLVVKKAIELRGINKNLWTDNQPIRETEAQPIIFNLIKSVGEIKGIQISRELVAANGSLDFHCSYTYKGKLLKSCIELKNGHHTEIIHGINFQLPKYITDEGNKHGIFLVLWYKNENFKNPTKYNSTNELYDELKKHIPKKVNIEIEIVDCTIKQPPSKKEKLPPTKNIGHLADSTKNEDISNK